MAPDWYDYLTPQGATTNEDLLMKSIIAKALMAMDCDGGCVWFSFSNGDEDVCIDIVDHNACRIGYEPVSFASALAHLDINSDYIDQVV